VGISFLVSLRGKERKKRCVNLIALLQHRSWGEKKRIKLSWREARKGGRRSKVVLSIMANVDCEKKKESEQVLEFKERKRKGGGGNKFYPAFYTNNCCSKRKKNEKHLFPRMGAKRRERKGGKGEEVFLPLSIPQYKKGRSRRERKNEQLFKS